jgi:hypothetical protein
MTSLTAQEQTLAFDNKKEQELQLKKDILDLYRKLGLPESPPSQDNYSGNWAYSYYLYK